MSEDPVFLLVSFFSFCIRLLFKLHTVSSMSLFFLYLLKILFCHPSLFTNSGGARGRWYKFNDNVVEEFDMNDETLEYECFGGEYRPKVYDQCKLLTLLYFMWISSTHKYKILNNFDVCSANPYPDVRRRYWNAYMLFYQKISDQNSPVLPKKSRVSIMRQEAEDLSLWVKFPYVPQSPCKHSHWTVENASVIFSYIHVQQSAKCHRRQ